MNSKVNILIVDDKIDNLTVLEAVLDSPDYNLVRATTGKEALASVEAYDFACILLDVQMPIMDGFETARRLRERPKTKDVPIIFITAIYSDDSYIHRAYESGAVDYIFKPFNPMILRSKVSIFVDLYQKTKLLLRQNDLMREREVTAIKAWSLERELATQKKYRDLVDSIHNCIVWSGDPLTRICTYASPGAETLTGYSVSAWCSGKDFWQRHVHPDDQTKLEEAFGLAMQGEDVQFEHRLICKNGEIMWFNTEIHLATDGELTEMRGLSVDITEVKKAQFELQKSEKKFRTLTEAMPQIVWTCDANGVPQYLNQRWEDETGLSCNEFNWSWCDIIHPDDKEAVNAAWEAALVSKMDYEVECRMKMKNGYRWQLSRARAMKDADGKIMQWLGTCTDIEEQKRTEISQRFLAESSALLATSLDYQSTLKNVALLAVPKVADYCFIHLLDEDGKVALIAQSEGQALASSSIQLTSVTDRVKSVIKTGKSEPLKTSPSSICTPLIARGRAIGAITLFSNNLIYIDKDLAWAEELARCASLAIDNTRLYQNAENAIHTRDEFLSIASHELKTPLTPLKLQFQSIKKMIGGGNLDKIPLDKLGKMLDRSDRQLNRITNLIDDLLNVSRINLGQMGLELKMTNLSQIIGDVVEQFRDQFIVSGNRVELDLDESIHGLWDPFRLEQVLVNLLTNAIKYGNKECIKISTRIDGQSAKLTVTDRGIGIAASDQKRIFALFERAVPARNYGGLGLGLYIVKNIIEKHSGVISVESEIGMGSTFTVLLPLKTKIKESSLANEVRSSSASL